jgi:hypothetical protein
MVPHKIKTRSKIKASSLEGGQRRVTNKSTNEDDF